MGHKTSSQTFYWPPDSGGYVRVRGTITRQWDTQSPPYKSTMGYGYQKDMVLNFTSTRPLYAGGYPDGIGFVTPNETNARNRNYAKMVDKLGNASQWANNLLEARESIDSVVGRAGQLLSFARNLRKGNFSGAAKALGQPKPSTKQMRSLDKAKSFGDQFLEFHFGWVPMVQDIGSALDTLNKTDFGSRTLRSSGRITSRSHDRYEGGAPQYYRIVDSTATTTVKSTITTRVTNPNAFLASQLGFVNPLSVAWEAVPYSFVVDWFSNVGQVLASSTDFVGVEISNPCTVVATIASSSQIISGQYDGDDGHTHDYSSSQNDIYVRIARSPRFDGPTLEVKPFKGMSVTRGATAIALLLQHL
jgi:hypothetical protein